MEINESKVFIKKYLVIILASVLLVSLIYIIGTESLFTALLATVLLLVVGFFLIYYLMSAVLILFIYIFKKKEQFDWLHVVNFVLSFLIFFFFMRFYLSLAGAIILQML